MTRTPRSRPVSGPGTSAGKFPGHIRKYLWGEHFWSPSSFAASCGGVPLAVIKEYIEKQKRPG
ncbi:hypothetical protein GCM10010254_25720 [Streptomyces chromofuscus]|uniref:transposase n=1 Tax=Streptomyces chromofuscus TaxID=42881 RepID=UPI0019ABCC17|nr:hypothetical protein GCM10010254_25720 [Streptomyces chromofuscus]